MKSESEKRAMEKWGNGWNLLSSDMQKMAINQEKLFLIKSEIRSAATHGDRHISISFLEELIDC